MRIAFLLSGLFLMLLLPLFPLAQQVFQVTGMVKDSLNRQPIEYASVVAFKMADSTMITGAVTDARGTFIIRGLPPGNYFLKTNFIGYKTGWKKFTLKNDAHTLESPILMAATSIGLTEVQITAQQNAKQVSIEKTRIDVSKNPSSVSGNITDVLKSQSNITIDAEDNVYLRGSNKILLLIDGKPATVGSLNAIPASAVENIDIITNPDVKYDAEGTGGIINIITKRRLTEGLSAVATLNYGLPDRVNGGLSINMSKNIFDIALTYSGRYEKTSIHSTLDRYIASEGLEINQDIHSTQRSPNQTVNLFASLRPGKKDLLSFNGKFLTNNLTNTQEITGKQTDDSLNLLNYTRLNEVTWDRKTVEGTVSYKHIFIRNNHELSADIMYSSTKGSRPADYYINGKYLQKGLAGGKPTNITVQADYFIRICKTGRIETGLKFFSRWNSFNSVFYNLDTLNSIWVPDSTVSNDLSLLENIWSAYLMYSDSIAGKVYYKVGARLEYNTSFLTQVSTHDTIDENYLYPFPFLLLKYDAREKHKLALSLNRRVTRPTMGQLNPFIIVVDQMTYETGNKYLIPEILDKAEFSYSFIGEVLQIRNALYASTSRNFITQVTYLSTADYLIVTYANGNRQNKFGLDVDATVKWGKKLTISPALSAFYSVSSGEYQGIGLSSEGFAWTGNVKALFKPEKKTELQLFLSYSSPVSLPQFDLDRIWYIDVSAKRSFFQNRFSISLTVTDVFNTKKWMVSTQNQVYSLSNNSKYETRVVWVGLTYNFNAFKSSRTQKTEGEGENGMIRLGH